MVAAGVRVTVSTSDGTRRGGFWSERRRRADRIPVNDALARAVVGQYLAGHSLAVGLEYRADCVFFTDDRELVRYRFHAVRATDGSIALTRLEGGGQ